MTEIVYRIEPDAMQGQMTDYITVRIASGGSRAHCTCNTCF